MLSGAVLEIDADADGDGNEETGVFYMLGNVNASIRVEKDYFLGPGRGSAVNAILDRISNGEVGEPRQGFAVDIGAGRHVVELDFTGWEGATDKNGNDVQWGNSDDPNVTNQASATGARPITQMQVFFEYINQASTDSFAPARLYIGEWTDGTYGTQGIFNDYLNVAVQQPRGLRETENFSTWSGSIICVEIFTLDEPVDIIEQEVF